MPGQHKSRKNKRRRHTSQPNTLYLIDFERIQPPGYSGFAMPVGETSAADLADRGYFADKPGVKYHFRPALPGEKTLGATHVLLHYCTKHNLFFRAYIRFYRGSDVMARAGQSDLWRLWMLLGGADLQWVEYMAATLNSQGIPVTSFYHIPAESYSDAQKRGGLGVIINGEYVPPKGSTTWH
ncbi:hypothetical protein HQR70_003004 [Salmonella enterica]|nr:hypothetical protein [Salmonella enterica]EFU0044586.1 hypothetical protein [Salmonella enterica]EFV5166798.1 hypothetical protein [Salmonella enterica]